MDAIKDHMTQITRILAYLKNEISLSNTLNLTDINIHAENFYRDLFSLIYGYDFVNANSIKQNASFIDLINQEHKIAIQVTSQNDSGKINKTIEGFFGNPEYKDFQLNVLLIAKAAKDYTSDFTHNGLYKFNVETDIIDFEKLLAKINDLKLDEIIRIHTLLEKHINIPRVKTQSNEVETIMALINFLSNDKNRIPVINESEVNPYKKINERFAEYSEYIKTQYESLLGVYSTSLEVAKTSTGLDGVMVEIISSYLKDESHNILMKNNYDPMLALYELTEFFDTKLSQSGIKYDKQAIKFYLLDELIECNVFPIIKG